MCPSPGELVHQLARERLIHWRIVQLAELLDARVSVCTCVCACVCVWVSIRKKLAL